MPALQGDGKLISCGWVMVMRCGQRCLLLVVGFLLCLLAGCAGGGQLPHAVCSEGIALELGLSRGETLARMQSCSNRPTVFFCEGELCRIQCMLSAEQGWLPEDRGIDWLHTDFDGLIEIGEPWRAVFDPETNDSFSSVYNREGCPTEAPRLPGEVAFLERNRLEKLSDGPTAMVSAIPMRC